MCFVVWFVGGMYGCSWGEVLMLLLWCVFVVLVFVWFVKLFDMFVFGDD